jgi:hypothetical protein
MSKGNCSKTKSGAQKLTGSRRGLGRRGRDAAPHLKQSIVTIQTLPGLSVAVPEEKIEMNTAPRLNLQARLRQATRPEFVELAPGKWVPNPECQRAEVGGQSEYTLARWAKNADGTFSPIPFTERMVRVDLRVLQYLGFKRQNHTLTRLATAGFIEMVKIAPGTWFLNLNSLYNHMARCAENPEFWDKGKGNFEEYKKAI